MADLKPCPYCKGTLTFHPGWNRHINCNGCAAYLYTSDFEDDLTELANERPPHSAWRLGTIKSTKPHFDDTRALPHPAPVQPDHCEDALNMVQAEQSLEVVEGIAADDWIDGAWDDTHGNGLFATSDAIRQFTDHAKATAALAQKDAEIAELKLELSVSDKLQRERLVTLRAHLAEAEKDAERYRWLRWNSGYTIRCNLFGDVGMREHKDADLDALIDQNCSDDEAALSSQQEGKKACTT